ncbi:MAG: hypothetical protein JWL86_2442 [Rhizobium sp.]|nr:hypothetical protein [Rhizobium sp.]
MTKLKTPAIVAISMAVGLLAGAGINTVAQSQTKTTIIIKKGNNNDQPNMRAALDNLNAANVYLDRAANNKGGHKAKAQSLIRLAIGEVRAGIKFAN